MSRLLANARAPLPYRRVLAGFAIMVLLLGGGAVYATDVVDAQTVKQAPDSPPAAKGPKDKRKPKVTAAIVVGAAVIVATIAPALRTAQYLFEDARFPGTTGNVSIELDTYPPDLIRAFIAAEDGGYCNHSGVDLAALWDEWQRVRRTEKPARGRSTIAQQVAKNLFTQGEHTVWRKVRDAFWGFYLDKVPGKRETMRIYLANLPLGKDVYGVKAGALHHFGKEPKDLSPKEMALLAALAPAPSKLKPTDPGPQGRTAETLKGMKFVYDMRWDRCVVTPKHRQVWKNRPRGKH